MLAVEERFRASSDERVERRRSPWWGMHVARYEFALPYAAAADSILDVACGSGYGAALLSRTGGHVTGVDINVAAVRDAAAASTSVSFAVASGTALPFGGDTFDLITSMETLEHLPDRQAFIAELRRTLRPRGTLLLSTPNAHYTNPVNGIPTNPYHVHEYTPSELREELSIAFPSVHLLGQTVDPRRSISPFKEDQQAIPEARRQRARLLGWRVANKLPAPVRDLAAHALTGAAFYPSEYDWRFSRDTVENAPVLFAVCRLA